MPELFPFRGLRYSTPDELNAVTAPPYDVIDEDERAALERSHPNNAVQLILPRHDGDDGYDAAATTIDQWVESGVLRKDEQPDLYAYRMVYEDADGNPRHTLGVIGALELPAKPGQGDVLPHERTLPKAKSDRLALLRATRANLDPIWGLSLAEGLTKAIGELDPATTVHSVDPSGTRHELAPLPLDRVDAVSALLRSAPVVIADGHHRFETACSYRAEAADTPGVGAIMALVVELTEDELCVHAIHRLLHGEGDLRERLAAHPDVEVEPFGPNTHDAMHDLRVRLREDGALGFVDREGLALLHLQEEHIERHLEGVPEVLHGVDAVRFDLGVRPGLGDVELAYRDDASTCASLVDKGAADGVVLLEPVSVAQIRAAAVAGVRMPEKTTYFNPKPRTGMLFRTLDD